MHESLGVHNDLQPLSDEEFDYFISAKDSISSLLVHGEGDWHMCSYLPSLCQVYSKSDHIYSTMLEGWTTMRREDPIFAQTMTRSKAHLPSTEGEAKGEGAQGEDIAAEGGNTDEEIDNFTLGLDDMKALPSQA